MAEDNDQKKKNWLGRFSRDKISTSLRKIADTIKPPKESEEARIAKRQADKDMLGETSTKALALYRHSSAVRFRIIALGGAVLTAIQAIPGYIQSNGGIISTVTTCCAIIYVNNFFEKENKAHEYIGEKAQQEQKALNPHGDKKYDPNLLSLKEFERKFQHSEKVNPSWWTLFNPAKWAVFNRKDPARVKHYKPDRLTLVIIPLLGVLGTTMFFELPKDKKSECDNDRKEKPTLSHQTQRKPKLLEKTLREETEKVFKEKGPGNDASQQSPRLQGPLLEDGSCHQTSPQPEGC